LKPEDRPDLVSRLFKIKLNDLLKEIKRGDVFGKVKSGKHYSYLIKLCQTVYVIKNYCKLYVV